VAPICALVQEAVSARLDGEVSPLEDETVAAHLARCASCAAFAQAVPRLRAACAPLPAAAALERAVAASRARTKARGPRVGALGDLLRHPSALAADPLAWALPAMALGVALPPVALGVLGHLAAAHGDLVPRCASLLARHLHR
jgi:anti-sigma factor RsiW